MSLLNEILNKNKSKVKQLTERINYDLDTQVDLKVDYTKYVKEVNDDIKNDNTKDIPPTIQKDNTKNTKNELTLKEELAQIKKECPWYFLKDEADSYKNNDTFLHKLYVMKKHDRETYNQMIKGE